MGDTSFTPGPWFIGSDCTIHAPDPEAPQEPWAVAVSNMSCGYPVVQDRANAHLIAAAPDLYEALESALEDLWGERHSHQDRAAFERDLASEFAALRKACGEVA